MTLWNNHNLTQALQRWHAGDDHALDEMVEAIYPLCLEMINRKVGRQLTPTFSRHDLAQMVLQRLPALRGRDINSGTHLHNLIARMVFGEVADHFRSRNAVKRGGGEAAVPFDESWMTPEQAYLYEKIMVHQFIDKYAEINADGAGMFVFHHVFDETYEEIAERYAVSPTTVKRYVKAARLWLLSKMNDDGTPV